LHYSYCPRSTKRWLAPTNCQTPLMKMTQNKSRIADGAWNLSLSFQPSALLLAIAISLRVVIWRGLSGGSEWGAGGLQPPLIAGFQANHCSKSMISPLNLHANQHLHCFSPPLSHIVHPPLRGLLGFLLHTVFWTSVCPCSLLWRP
jgi:hypothetical protein